MANTVASCIYAVVNSISRKEVLLFCILFSIISTSNCTEDENLPACQEGASCGVVQANRHGIYFQRLCKCQDEEVCPFGYGYNDGRSIRQHINEWKYCKQAPTLSECREGDIAYETMASYDLETGEKFINHHSILCHCPENFTFKMNRTMNFESPTSCGNSRMVHLLTRHTCTKLPTCRDKDTCRIITHSKSGVFYDERCTCETGSCPLENTKAHFKFPGSKGTAYLFRCS